MKGKLFIGPPSAEKKNCKIMVSKGWLVSTKHSSLQAVKDLPSLYQVRHVYMYTAPVLYKLHSAYQYG